MRLLIAHTTAMSLLATGSQRPAHVAGVGSDAGAAPINSSNFAGATAVAIAAPLGAGNLETAQVTGFARNATVHVALRAVDDFGDQGPLSNVISATTSDAPAITATAPGVARVLSPAARHTSGPLAAAHDAQIAHAGRGPTNGAG